VRFPRRLGFITKLDHTKNVLAQIGAAVPPPFAGRQGFLRPPLVSRQGKDFIGKHLPFGPQAAK
jgi:hypothetical protein